MEVDMGSGDVSSPSGQGNIPHSPSVSASSRRSSVSHSEMDVGTNPTTISVGSERGGDHDSGGAGGVVAPDIPPIAGDNNNNNNNNTNQPKSTKPSSKPRSSRPHKPRSPSPTPPPPPPPPAPLQTIRLQIKLGGPDNYAVDIGGIARETGQRPPTPTRVPGIIVVSDSEDDDDHNDKDKGKGKVLKKKKKNPTSEYYDVSDPFIDDSELAIDERTYFAQTKQQGFYVSSGEVALMKDKTPKKPKSKNPLLGGPSTSISATTSKKVSGPTSKKPATTKTESGAGTRDSPVAVPSASGSDVEDSKAGIRGPDARAGEKRKRYVTVVEGGKKRKVVDVHSFHPDIQAEINVLKQAIAKESWDQKGKFPASLKPPLAQLAVLAIKLDEYDEYFFNLMPSLFPYNKFTMSKLIKRTVFQEHTALLMERQDALLVELAAQSKAGFAKAEEEWEKSVIAWDKRQERLRVDTAAGLVDGAPAGGTGTDSTGPTRHPTEEMDVDVSPSVALQDKEKDGHGQHPPGKKYRLTESMKAIVWQLVLLSNECCRLENEKNTLEGSVIQVSEQGLRKVLYQKIVAAFPEGWLSSGQISRDVSSMKKKFEKEAMEQEF